MIKRITDLQEMKRVAEVGDKIELPRSYDKIGVIICNNYHMYNVLINNSYFGDSDWIRNLEELICQYYKVWIKDGGITLIKEVVEDKSDPYSDFDASIGSKFKIYVEPYEFDCYCGETTLLNFNPSGQSAFLDKNEKLLIVETKDIKYMRALKENKSE